MKLVILAGGFGTRLSEYTESIPKPMVEVGNLPIVCHIIKYYFHFGIKDFYLALGYKSEVFHDYFNQFLIYKDSNKVDLRSIIKDDNKSDKAQICSINLIDTGLETMTGGRVKKIQEKIGLETFLLTYGDGLSNVNIKQLIEFHNKQKKTVTVTAVHPTARFGELTINKNGSVTNFKEKPQTSKDWINGGFFVIEPRFFDFIKDDQTILEREPLEEIAKEGQLMAFKHEGFWQCMDTKRDKDLLDELIDKKEAPWINYYK